jgi:uncharacterized protein (DUF1778 family)
LFSAARLILPGPYRGWVTLSQKKMLEKAAAAAMLDLSSWVRIVALAEAGRSLRAAKARE